MVKFYFLELIILVKESIDDIIGMYLIDDEGEIIIREVKGKFINGCFMAIEVMVIFNF